MLRLCPHDLYVFSDGKKDVAAAAACLHDSALFFWVHACGLQTTIDYDDQWHGTKGPRLGTYVSFGYRAE